MLRIAACAAAVSLLPALSAPPQAPDPKAAKPSAIVPGKPHVPTDRVRRIWGELVSLDLKTRTGVFRDERDDKRMAFTVLPFAELLHHAAFGDLQDFRVGERAIFRLHENDAGEWVLLTYIQDELNFLVGHKEYYHVDRIDAEKGVIEYTQGNADKSYVRAKGLTLEIDKDTRCWKDGRPAAIAEVKVGDRLRAKTHGRGAGRHRAAWEVFLDDASVERWRTGQQAVHRTRMAEEGLPGYVDAVDPAARTVRMTLFLEARDAAAGLKAGLPVRLAPAGADRKPSAGWAAGTLTEIRLAKRWYEATVTLDAAPDTGLVPTGVARLLPGPGR
jgi:hypothetical protein